MQDRTIGINCLAAWLLWTLAAGLWIASVIWDSRPPATLAIMVCIGAATVTVRGLLREHDRGIKNALVVTQEVRSDGVRVLR